MGGVRAFMPAFLALGIGTTLLARVAPDWALRHNLHPLNYWNPILALVALSVAMAGLLLAPRIQENFPTAEAVCFLVAGACIGFAFSIFPAFLFLPGID